MDKDFFIKLAFGTHKVADLLKDGKALKESANSLLADLMVFCEDNPVTLDQKRNILPRTLRQIEGLQRYFAQARFSNKSINPKNFLILEKEYSRIPAMLIGFLGSQKAPEVLAPKPEMKQEPSLSQRQRRIIELLRNKETTQVWELQKVLPEVTKRTLRRDLDELLKLNLVERQGEWNAVFYRMKK
ncbi:MAG: DeoR family transcriptional regulator [Candidatus Wildermuthbacteria bacterium]|nr:DeoR family transcriptional regulator [Candidatus Wildermuthbacteria bacterium]